LPQTGFIDHIGIGVPDLVAAKEYYDDLMSVLGLREWFESSPGGPFNYGPDGDKGTQLFFYQAEEPGTYSRLHTGLHHIAFLVASRAVVRDANQWAHARHAVVLDEPSEFPQYGPALLCDLLARSSWNQARGGLPQSRREPLEPGVSWGNHRLCVEATGVELTVLSGAAGSVSGDREVHVVLRAARPAPAPAPADRMECLHHGRCHHPPT
jgi:catechol 2,3-dioxygenase-like lactoylglutathione lyase family enzyme